MSPYSRSRRLALNTAIEPVGMLLSLRGTLLISLVLVLLITSGGAG